MEIAASAMHTCAREGQEGGRPPLTLLLLCVMVSYVAVTLLW